MDTQREFDLGNDGPHDEDKWLLEKGIDHVLSLPGHDQLSWLMDTCLAREENAEELACNASQPAAAMLFAVLQLCFSKCSSWCSPGLWSSCMSPF